MKMSFSKKCEWAKKALIAGSDEKLYKIAKESGLGIRWITYYLNAYEAAGKSGIKALTYRKKMPLGIQEKALEKLDKYLSEKYPPHLRSEIDFDVKAESNRIIAYEKRPSFMDPSKLTFTETFQVRYTDFDDRWHLYWMRKFHIWWPYIPGKPVYTIDDCIREVEGDPWGCFFG